MQLDRHCKFIWNLCDVEESSCEEVEGGFYNLDTQTFPGIAHANGGSKQGAIFLSMLKSLGL